jgi:hypothetical protein
MKSEESMPKNMAHEPANHETRLQTKTKPEQAALRRRGDDEDARTECGFTREELRALVVEMIG